MPDQALGGSASVPHERGQSRMCCGFVGHPWVRHPVGKPVRAVAGDLGEGVVDLDDGAVVVGDEEALLQRVHQRATELVAVGEVLGAGPLLFVTPCAVKESASGNVECRQRLQQELQGGGGVGGRLGRAASTSREWFSMMSSTLIRSCRARRPSSCPIARLASSARLEIRRCSASA